MLKYFLLWFPMLIIAIANGGAREWYKKFTGELVGRQLSTLLLILLFGIYIFWVVALFPPKSDQEAWTIGILWLFLTLCFEFGFGRFRGNSWRQLIAEYDISRGKLWILIPIWIVVAPYLFSQAVICKAAFYICNRLILTPLLI